MPPPLQFSTYNNDDSAKIKRNKTYKKKPPTKKVQSFLAAMDTEDNGMADFTPPAHPSMPSEPKYPAYPQKPQPITKKTESAEEDNDKSVESFTQLPSFSSTADYYKQYVPYYTNVENSSQLQGSRREELMEKLNYMIHLLEEQQEDKTSNVAEELILYLFLGIFVIFVVDSFARAAKYTR